MRLNPILVSVLLLVLIPLSVHSEIKLREQPGVEDAINILDMWIDQQVVHHKLPGLSIAVVFDQEIVWAKGYGYSDLAKKTPATPSTVYRLGSVTKVFTSTAIMQLRDQGKLRLDDPVSLYIPWFHIQSSFPDAPEITIRHLLTHTSGLPREADFPYWTDHIFPTGEQLRNVVPGQDAIAAPETTYHYSNLGMALLGDVIAEVSGRSWADYLQQEIFKPLGMSSSSARPGEELMQRRATPYMLMKADGTRDVFDYYDTGAIGPAANMVSNVEDLSRFASMQFHEGPAGNFSVLKGSTLREMQRVHWVYNSFSGGRGLGFYVSHRSDKNFVGHGGWIGGNRSHLLMVPSEKIAVIVMINADDRSPSFISNQIYGVMGPALLKATRVEPEVSEKKMDPVWQNYLGHYSDPWGWEYEVLILGGDLVMYSPGYPPDDDASSGYTRLTLIEGSTFRRPDNEVVKFELDENGKVVRIKRRNDYISPKKDN